MYVIVSEVTKTALDPVAHRDAGPGHSVFEGSRQLRRRALPGQGQPPNSWDPAARSRKA